MHTSSQYDKKHYRTHSLLRRSLKALCFGMVAGSLGMTAPALADDPVKVGFVYVSPIGGAGWTYEHDQGRKQMEEALAGKVETKYVENVPEGNDAERVIRDLANSGHKIIFTTAFGYMNPTIRVAKQFPDVVFLHNSGYKQAKNVGTYNIRFYEGRYLDGVIAGKMSKSGIAGIVASFPIPEVLQSINAFTQGMRSVDPDAEVRVIWTSSWYDPGKERDAAIALVSEGADMLTHHTNSTAVIQAAEEQGVHAFGHHSDMSEYGPKAQLTAMISSWGDYYTDTVQDVLNGTWKPTDLYGGFKEDMIKVAPLNASVPDDVRALVEKLEGELKNGTLHPFAGPIVDQSGKERVAAGEVMSDEDLNKMDYYVSGVSSKL